MSRHYSFTVDAEGQAFVDEVVDEMLRLFGIDEAEALARVNRQWSGVDFKPDDLRYHETAEFWANDIYFGPDSRWWMHPGNLVPRPRP
jgi:hypothetical protein